MALSAFMQENPDQPGAFDRAVEEYRVSQRFNADRAEAHMNLGNLEARLGNIAAAERAFRAALTVEPDFAPASVNLADLLRASGRDSEGEQVIRESLATRESAEAHHALGLLLIRRQQTATALEHLAAAARQMPEEPRYAYVYAIALHDSGDASQAIATLEQAHLSHPSNRDLLAALVIYCRELGLEQDALQWAERLEALTPQ